MTLTQHRSFIAVARHNGFTAAARVLKTSQTTITSQIQGLEEEHGIRLFERRGRRIALTQTVRICCRSREWNSKAVVSAALRSVR